MANGYCSSIGYFFGRLNYPDELTIAFLGENEPLLMGLASILSEIGPENLQVTCKLSLDGLAEITVFDKRDPENFSDTRKRPIEHVARFLHDLSEDKKFVVTIGTPDLSMDYQILRLELDQVDWINEYLN